MPTSKIPAIGNVRRNGNVPKAVGLPLAEVKVTLSPRFKPTLKDSLEGRANHDAPMIYHSLHSYLNDIQWDIEWIYIFRRGQWYVCEGMEVDDNYKILDKDFIENDFTPLVDTLTQLRLQEESA